MKYEIKYNPAYSLLEVNLEPKEVIVAEAGAMVYMSPTIKVQTRKREKKSFWKSLKTAFLGAESFFVNEYIAEGEIFTLPGFKSGLVAYGLCDRPNKILRIKLKYENSSKRFFNQLLKEYKKQLGDPTEYKGDPFQTLIAWKWSFSNKDNETISLILQHNVMVADEKIGTAVKMTLTSQLEKERACYMAHPPEPEKKRMNNAPQLTKKEMWRLFVPY